MASAKAALDRLRDPAAEVSAHYLIGEAGTVWALVDEDRRAWHAGAGAWGGVADVNSASIGIELQNPGDRPYPAPQMAALEALLAGILARHAIPPEGVIAHSDMAPLRKSDPGPRFDWRRLARAGLSVWPAGGGPAPPPAAFAALASRFGWPVAEAGEAAVLRAFRLRFRPWASGVPGTGELAAVAELAARWPARPETPG